MTDYGLCPVCGEPMTFDNDADVDLHSMPDGSDCHAECCPTCGADVKCPECEQPAIDDLGPDTDGEYEPDDDVPHVLICINDHEWLEDA